MLAILAGQLGDNFSLRPFSRRNLTWLGVMALILWGASGTYKVQPYEQGVVLRFGRWVATAGPGLHYHLPWPVDNVVFPKVTSINEVSASGLTMLTGDENIVEADYSVFWKISDAKSYLFHVGNPDGLVATAAESSVRSAIGRNPIQSAMSDQRQQIADDAAQRLQDLLNSYQAGIQIVQVHLERVDPPSAVIDAFNDVQRAKADQERERNEAEAYQNDILPRARGAADHLVAEGNSYKQQKISLAQGELSGYLAAYKAYKTSPEVVGWQMYLDGMDQLLAKAGKVVVDDSGKGMGSIVPYLPLGAASTNSGAKP